jgi:hypothetical protein
MRGRLEWGAAHGEEVRSVEELDRTLDALEREAQADPFIVELDRGDAGSLSLGLGRAVTVVDHVPADLDPPYRQAYAAEASTGSHWFRYSGEATEFPPDAGVPYEAGREALRHFLATGELTPELSWRET